MADMLQYLCIVGVDKHWIEKDLIKFFRKHFRGSPCEESKDVEDDIPLKGVAKKRGKTFGFLQFGSLEEKTDFMELFNVAIAPVKRLRLREVNKNDVQKGYKPVKGSSEMNADSLRRKQEMHASVTQADVDAVLSESIEQRVTPYANLTYPE